MVVAIVAAVVSLASGVAGTAVIDPASPVCAVDRPCVAPDPFETIVFRRSGRAVATATTTAKGTFRVALAPGLYTVSLPRRGRAGVRVAPTAIRVARGRMLHISIHVDIGIR
jgi:hypothetical protein